MFIFLPACQIPRVMLLRSLTSVGSLLCFVVFHMFFSPLVAQEIAISLPFLSRSSFFLVDENDHDSFLSFHLFPIRETALTPTVYQDGERRLSSSLSFLSFDPTGVSPLGVFLSSFTI